MSDFIEKVRTLVNNGDVRVSEHGYDRAVEEGIFFRDLVSSIAVAKIVEDYPDYPKGPCILLLHSDRSGKPIHAVWGIPKGYDRPIVLITAYRPDPQRWSSDFLQRQ